MIFSILYCQLNVMVYGIVAHGIILTVYFDHFSVYRINAVFQTEPVCVIARFRFRLWFGFRFRFRLKHRPLFDESKVDRLVSPRIVGEGKVSFFYGPSGYIGHRTDVVFLIVYAYEGETVRIVIFRYGYAVCHLSVRRCVFSVCILKIYIVEYELLSHILFLQGCLGLVIGCT